MQILYVRTIETESGVWESLFFISVSGISDAQESLRTTVLTCRNCLEILSLP